MRSTHFGRGTVLVPPVMGILHKVQRLSVGEILQISLSLFELFKQLRSEQLSWNFCANSISLGISTFNLASIQEEKGLRKWKVKEKNETFFKPRTRFVSVLG